MNQRTLKRASQKILELLEIEAATLGDILWITMGGKTGYHKRANWLASGRTKEEFQSSDWGFLEPWKERAKEYKKYHILLSRLQAQGLIEAASRKGRRWSLTRKGRERLTIERSKENIVTRFVEGDGLTIISYDIPESLRRERDRLREVLALLGFEPVQKSVWFASKKVTILFLQHLKDHKIIDHVQIFEVTKTGSLRERKNKKVG